MIKGDVVWDEEDRGTTIVIGLVVATVKFTMGAAVPLDP